MAAPVITIYDKGTTTVRSEWKPGTIKAGKTSDDVADSTNAYGTNTKSIDVDVWNNRAGAEDIHDMIECTVGAYDSKGTAEDDIAKNKWIEVNVNGETDGEGNLVYTAIGGTVEADIANTTVAAPSTLKEAVNGEGVSTYDPETQCVLAANPNTEAVGGTDGTNLSGAAVSGSRVQYANCKFRIAIPTQAKAGSTGFKIRFQGYYI